jgi:hypothetical protein
MGFFNQTVNKTIVKNAIQHITVSNTSLYPAYYCVKHIFISSILLCQTHLYIQQFTVSNTSLYPAYYCVKHIFISSILLCQTHLYIQQFTVSGKILCPHLFNFSLLTCCGRIMLHSRFEILYFSENVSI